MTQTYSTPTAPRIGRVKGAMLKTAIAAEVLGIVGNQHNMEKNRSDTVIFRRWLPYGGTNSVPDGINNWSVDPNQHMVQEGVTPNAETMKAQDIPVVLQQYACLYMYTDKVADLYEDGIPTAMKGQAGQRMGLLREMIRYGVMRGCANRFYAGGTTRATVDETITLPMLRKVTRSILGNRGQLVTKILSAGPLFNTAPIEAAMLVFCHTHCENDIRNLPGFREVAAYGQRQPVHPMELGSTDRYRFIVSPELFSYPNAGAAVGTTGLQSTGGTNIDVYPMIVMAEDAFGDVALRGLKSFDLIHLPHTATSKSDPLSQRGYIGGKFWSAPFIENDGWMAVVEVGVTDL